MDLLEAAKLLPPSLLLSFSLLAAPPVPAISQQRPTPPPTERADVVENWMERIQTADQEVRDGEYKRSVRSMNRVLDEMSGWIVSGPQVGEMLGLATAVRALARAGRGDEENAAWDWQIARLMAPRFAGLDLSAYGDAGHRLRAAIASSSYDTGERSEGPATLVNPAITPPVRLHAPPPHFPGARRVACLEDVLVVLMVIDEKGLPHDPRILSSPSEVASFTFLDALRKWTFEPARLDGEPVAVYYNLTVNFRVSYCADAVARFRQSKQESD